MTTPVLLLDDRLACEPTCSAYPTSPAEPPAGADLGDLWGAEVLALTRLAAPPAREQEGPAAPCGWPALPGYEILGELGRGGMSVVYKARDLRLWRLVAVKVIDHARPGQREVVARFRREQVLAAGLKHPNLVAALDAGQAAGWSYLAMEFVEGAALASLIRRRGPFPVACACEVARQAALGLGHLHEHGLVHRDVKPANLMLTPSGRVKVLDLGVALPLRGPGWAEPITSHGQCLGTLDYMAPEQCVNAHAVDGRADVYGLGCTLYELLAGQPPFGGPAYSSAYLKMKAHVEAPVPPLAERRPDVPGRLLGVLERMLAKDPDRRFPHPAAVGAALRTFTAEAGLAGLAPARPAGVAGAA
jgi:serine/threonine protein kinase